MPARTIGLLATVGGVFAVLALVLFRRDVQAEARSGPAWKQRLVTAGLLVLGGLGFGAVNSCFTCYDVAVVDQEPPSPTPSPSFGPTCYTPTPPAGGWDTPAPEPEDSPTPTPDSPESPSPSATPTPPVIHSDLRLDLFERVLQRGVLKPEVAARVVDGLVTGVAVLDRGRSRDAAAIERLRAKVSRRA